MTLLLINAIPTNNKFNLIHDHIEEERADLAYITETWVGSGGGVTLFQMCPPRVLCSAPGQIEGVGWVGHSCIQILHPYQQDCLTFELRSQVSAPDGGA